MTPNNPYTTSNESADHYVEIQPGKKLCFRAYGPPNGEAVLLIAGLGLQLTSWPASFIEAFVANGYRVIAPDNRDTGRSFEVSGVPPTTWEILTRRAPNAPYTLEDMADDMVDLLDQLGIQKVHLVGMSMGGMIAQTVAARHPSRVWTLTSLFSTTGRRTVGYPAWSTIFKLLLPPPKTVQEVVDSYWSMMRHIGDHTVPGIQERLEAYSRNAWVRQGNRADPSRLGRKIGAIIKSGDRTDSLRNIKAPTLVIHGAIDKMVHPSGGKATANAIPNARFVILPKLRHQIDDERSKELTDLILQHMASEHRCS